MNLIITSTNIRTDAEGRFCLNDLHKASGGAPRHKPSEWLRNAQTQALIDEIEKAGNPAIYTKQRIGTFVAKELVYAYAMWISAPFQLQVIRAFDALANGRLEEAAAIASRQSAKLEAPFLTDAVKHARESKGKPVAHYHFTNEFDLINRIALGMPAKKYRDHHGIGKAEAIRDHLTPCEIRCIEHLQRANSTMIDMGMDFEARKAELSKLYMRRHAAALLDEVHRLEG